MTSSPRGGAEARGRSSIQMATRLSVRWLPGDFDDSPQLVAIRRVRRHLRARRAPGSRRAPRRAFRGPRRSLTSVRRPPERSSIRLGSSSGVVPSAPRQLGHLPAGHAAGAPRSPAAGSPRSSRRAGCAARARGSGRSRGGARSSPSRSRSRARIEPSARSRRPSSSIAGGDQPGALERGHPRDRDGQAACRGSPRRARARSSPTRAALVVRLRGHRVRVGDHQDGAVQAVGGL